MRKLLSILFVISLLTSHLSQAQQPGMYALSISVVGNGRVIPEKTEAAPGETVTLTIIPDDGYVLQYIEGFFGTEGTTGASFQISVTQIDEAHYTVYMASDIVVTAYFIPRRPDTGKTAYAVYLEDSTLYFTYIPDALSIGDTFHNSRIAYLWSGIDVTDTPTKTTYLPKWNQFEEVESEYNRVVFDESFQELTPSSTCNWFAAYFYDGPTTIEGLQYLNTSEVTSMYGMFQYCSRLTQIDLSHFDTHNVANMGCMFEGCTSLTQLDLSSFDTQNVTSFSGLFAGCSSLTSLDISHLDTRKVVNMVGMFKDCSSLTSIDVTHFQTPCLERMSQMFSGCKGLTSLDLTHLNTSSVTFMYGLFMGCSSLTSLDLSRFNAGKLTNSGRMFYGCTSLEQIICDDSWQATASANMFYNCSKLHGAVAWDASYVNVAMANPYTGYFTFSNGDLNADGVWDEIDVRLLAFMIANGAPVTQVSDINKDGRLSLSDVTALVNRIRQAPS